MNVRAELKTGFDFGQSHWPQWMCSSRKEYVFFLFLCHLFNNIHYLILFAIKTHNKIKTADSNSRGRFVYLLRMAWATCICHLSIQFFVHGALFRFLMIELFFGGNIEHCHRQRLPTQCPKNFGFFFHEEWVFFQCTAKCDTEKIAVKWKE